jgi:hypothetical protein
MIFKTKNITVNGWWLLVALTVVPVLIGLVDSAYYHSFAPLWLVLVSLTAPFLATFALLATIGALAVKWLVRRKKQKSN